MAKNKITSIPIFGRPAWSRVEVGRFAHKERAWAERRLAGRITELNQYMWRVTQRLDLETSRCASVPLRPNSSLVAAHCARTRTNLRTCVDVLLYAMGRLQLCMPRRLDCYAQVTHQSEFQQHGVTTASLMSTAFIDFIDSTAAAAAGSEAVTSTPDITPPQYDVFNDDLLMVELDDVDAFFVDVCKSERCDSDAGYDDDDDGLLADHVPARAQLLATWADEVSDEDLGAYTAVLDREDVSSWATIMQMECQLARLNEMAKL